MEQLYILFVSSLCSKEKYAEVKKIRKKDSLDPSNRLFQSFVKGLSSFANITCISALPVSRSNCNINLFEQSEEINDKVKYKYLGFHNKGFRRYLDLYRNSKKEINNWIKETNGKKRILVCDSLVLMCAKPCRIIAKKNHIPTVAFVTDYPSKATSIKTSKITIKSFFQLLFDKIADCDLEKYDSYILVSKFLTELIKNAKQNHLVIEDIISTINTCDGTIDNDTFEEFSIIYGGALCKRFGINTLVDSFDYIAEENITISFYGSGESSDYILSKAKKDKRIKFFGVVPYEELQQLQQKADLLINPRPSDEDFCKYSFPSKTLSYMITGTPVLSTRIPGIPNEYRDYLYWIDDETSKGIANAIHEVYLKSNAERFLLGEQAKKFVLSYKTSEYQCKKIIDYFKTKFKF